MNNNWLIIVLPALALGGFAYGVWQRQMARHDAERAFEKKHTLLQEDYQELQEHIKEIDKHDTLTTARADGLEQEVERLIITNAALNNEITILHERGIDILSQLSASQAEIERLNEAAHPAPFVVEKGYVDVETTVTQDHAKPVRTRKRQATNPESH